MEMYEIYEGLSKRLQQMEPAYLQEKTKFDFHMEEAAKAEANMNQLKVNVDALKDALAALERGDFTPLKEVTSEEINVESVIIAEETKDVVEEKKQVKQLTWTKKNPYLGQYDRYGNKMNHWRNQTAAARDLGWSQSGISHFMKFDKEQQIRKKNFYFAWEY